MARPGRHRLTLDIPIEIHKEITKMAKKHYCTVTMYILRTMIEKLKEEKKYE